MSVNVAYKFGAGITPLQFMEGMQKNKEAFQANYDKFAWQSEEDRAFFEGLQGKSNLRVLILAADWCGDVVRSVPVVFQALEASGLTAEVFILEQHQDLMEHFLTNGGRSVPIIIFADDRGQVLGQWGPRPEHVQALMIEFKRQNPDREAPDYEEKIGEVRKAMAARYEEGAGVNGSVVTELRKLISGLI